MNTFTIFKTTFFAILAFSSGSIMAATYTTVQDGPWDDEATWDCSCSPSIPPFTDWSLSTYNINHNISLDTDTELNGDATFNIGSDGVIDANGNLIFKNDIILNFSGGTINTTGNLTFERPSVNGDAKITTGGDLIIKGGAFKPSSIDATIGAEFSIIDGVVDIGPGVMAMDDYLIIGGASASIAADMIVENNFTVANGPETTYGYVEVKGNFQKSGGSLITFTDDVKITGSMSLTGGNTDVDIFVNDEVFVTASSFYGDGDTEIKTEGYLDFTSGNVHLNGNAKVTGPGEIGWDTFTSANGGYMICMDGNKYDADPGNNDPEDTDEEVVPYPPANPLNLSTCETGTLPVGLISFKGTASPSGAILKWSTGYEEDNQYFIIEKSTNGQNFIEIGTVEGSGFSNNISHYSFTDNEAGEEGAYYRLKQVDYNGASTTSNIIYVDLLNQITGVYPNPVTGDILHFKNSESYTSFRITSVSGVIIGEEGFMRETGNNGIDVSGLQPGLYILTATGEAGSYQEKFIRK